MRRRWLRTPISEDRWIWRLRGFETVVLGIAFEVYTAGGGCCGAWFVEGGREED